jgi:two-component system OmpR family sensor kinase
LTQSSGLLAVKAPGRRWYRSLYWRIALGFIVLLAMMLGVQAASFVWIAVQTEGGVPERVGRDFAELVAREFEAALVDEPGLDLKRYATTRLQELARPTFVTFPDGTVIAPPGETVPPGIQRFAELGQRRRTLGRGPEGPPERRPPPEMSGRRPRDDRGPWPGPGAEGPPPMFGRRRLAIAPVRSQGETVAVVLVSPSVGGRRIAEVLGPWISVGAFLLLVGGTAIAALLVFRPAHTQLRALEVAAKRLGAGDLSARAPGGGGDEVAAVADAFNRMAAELAARQAQLVDADRARRQLLADVSHELMTPLTAIHGYAETLTMPQFQPAAPEGQRHVQIIQEEVERIERLVGDLLDLARYEAGGVSLVTEDVRVADLFDRVINRHEKAAQEKGVSLDVRLPDQGLHIVADPGRMEQALQNLATNALRHTPAGGRITLSGERTGRRTFLLVADTGKGIPADHLPHVFDRFYKADPSRTESGSGLGLSIVRAIVERHGGRVAARSTPGVETVFEIELPASSLEGDPEGSPLRTPRRNL